MSDTPTPDTPTPHDDQIDRLLRDAGARMRAATEVDHLSSSRPIDRRGTPRRWIVPVAIVTATAAAVVAAVWIAGPATETVREAPADTGVVSTPDSAADSLPVVAPVESSVPTETAGPETTERPIAPEAGLPVVTITEADFDQAGGMCVRLVAGADSADACLTNRQLQDTATWTVAFAEQAFEVTLGRLEPEGISVTASDDVCGFAASMLVQDRWLDTSCSFDQYVEHFWFVAAPETPSSDATTFVMPPRTGVPVALQPIASALPDGFVAYRADYQESALNFRCLVVASFPDPWREACVYNTDLPRMLVPAGGSVFLVEASPDLASVDVTDIAELSVPIAGCTAPVSEIAAALSSSVMISGLVCAGANAVASVPPVYLRAGPLDGAGYDLHRAADGTWSTPGGGTSFPCDSDPLPICEAMGVDGELYDAPLPIPPWGLIGASEHDLDPVEITAEVREISGGARNAEEIAASVIARYDDRTPGDGRDPVVEAFEALGLVVVELTLLDDSTTNARYAVWYRPTDSGELRVERAFRINVCGRGVAAPDMCV